MKYKKKLIEVALPLDAINKESLHRKTKAPKGWPSSFHKWWAQRPLSAAKAVIFAQMVDDPSSIPEKFPTKELQDAERQRLFKIVEDLILWDNSHDDRAIRSAHKEIIDSWKRTCLEHSSEKNSDIYNPDVLPPFCDPFAGGGTLPLAAQWLGLKSYASDLNPVAVLINKALLEIPSRFVNCPPISSHGNSQKNLLKSEWKNAQGLAADVLFYCEQLKDEAKKRIGNIFEDVLITADIVNTRPDLKPYLNEKLTVIAWIWARTVKSPNPAFSNISVPLASTFSLSTKKGKEAYIEPVVGSDGYKFIVKTGEPTDWSIIKSGTKLARGANFKCLMSNQSMSNEYIRGEFQAKRDGKCLMAIVAEGSRGRVYLSPTSEQEALAFSMEPLWIPEQEMNQETSTLVSGRGYGITHWHELFSKRQLVTLSNFYQIALGLKEKIKEDAINFGMVDDSKGLHLNGNGAEAYADAIVTYMACVIDRMAYYGSVLVGWLPKDSALGPSMPRQAIPMSWDFAEANPFAKSSGDISTCANAISNFLEYSTPFSDGFAKQCTAQSALADNQYYVVSTDPPYYDNIAYADLSDFFYVLIRNPLKNIFPELFATLAVPKDEELVATPYRHGGKEKAEQFFLAGMTEAMTRLSQQSHPAFPVTIYYAFKQSEQDDENGATNTGWDTFLEAVIQAGFEITGTWPMRTEGASRMIAMGTNALASSIILVCRKRLGTPTTITRREFITILKEELPAALALLQAGNIAPVDLAQAAIGPGMAVYTRFAKVLDAGGNVLSVRSALSLINLTLDEALAEQEGDFDADSRWALSWFDQNGFSQGEYGVAEQLSVARNTSVEGLVADGIVSSRAGKVRLLLPSELNPKWDPLTDSRLTAWEIVHQLIRNLELHGEAEAAKLVSKLGGHAEIARELCYRLFALCEKKKRPAEAMSYNGLVQSWPEIIRLSRETSPASNAGNQDLFDQE